MCQEVVDRIKRLYDDCSTTEVVNNILGQSFPNIRGSLRQGDVPSMYWFGIGIDPLLTYLERRLAGIPITSLPVAGPRAEDDGHSVLPPHQQHYKVVAYAEDVKTSITSIDQACSLL